jgi:hypothetical protein
MRLLCALLASFLALVPAATSYAGDLVVLAATGDVKFNNKPVATGDVVPAQGTLATGEDGEAKVFVKDAKAISILKPSSKVAFGSSKKNPGNFRLLEGLSRWVISKVKGKKPVIVNTRTAVMGVRGTEFMAIYNSVLEETEIVSFDGNVDFRARGKGKRKVTVKTGQWGGVGGRFGPDVNKISDLPPKVLSYFEGKTKLDTALKGAVTNDDYHGHAVPK